MAEQKRTSGSSGNGPQGEMAAGAMAQVSEGFEGERGVPGRAMQAPEVPRAPEFLDADQSVSNEQGARPEAAELRRVGDRELAAPRALLQLHAREAAYEEADERVLLDAWYATYAPPALRAFVQRERVEGRSAPEVVIGPDDRIRITTTTEFPWRAICSLLITAGDGSQWIGTGWFAGPRLVVTAGHCVFMRNQGGWVRSIEVIPSRNATQRPYGSRVATSFRSVQGWTQNQDRSYDYGAILLTGGAAPGNQVGWFGFATRSDSDLSSYTLNLSGYPGDKIPVGTQWWHAQQTQSVTARTIVYQTDTAGGQSGAPVWLYRDGARQVLGIHTNGASSGNSATRIVQPVFNNLQSWNNEAGP
ncbi:serine protease [Myxococcus xanthus]|uniref:trypsin-like serine peptidase n=1 Tax=Myxococcus xanthus TaxID=34 RepID=UPI0019172199|nr:serine protease [Myxococcus xanthus]QQR43433.1 serine protease [Myxococcus xanthus]